jgi:hypothetical protein
MAPSDDSTGLAATAVPGGDDWGYMIDAGAYRREDGTRSVERILAVALATPAA